MDIEMHRDHMTLGMGTWNGGMRAGSPALRLKDRAGALCGRSHWLVRHGPLGTEMETKAIEMGKSGTGARIMSAIYDSVQDKRKRMAHRWKEVATV
jgi:hypothetical protein